MLDRTRYTDGLGAIYPAMMYFIMALDALGYPDDHPDLIEARRQFDDLLIETDDAFYFQPCVSPVWDTAIAAFALGEMGGAPPDRADPARRTGCSARKCGAAATGPYKRPDLEPSGWAFEFANEYYPDIDDTAMVLLALMHAQASDPEAQDALRAARHELAARHAVAATAAGRPSTWTTTGPSSTGCRSPTTTPCSTRPARTSPGACWNRCAGAASTLATTRRARGVEYLLGCQEKNGSWYGRWGVNYIYGTFLALRGLTRQPPRMPARRSARPSEWLRSGPERGRRLGRKLRQLRA